MRKKKNIQSQRARRAFRVRSGVKGTSVRPRLSIFRSNRFTVAQLIDDVAGKTLASASSREFSAKGGSLPVRQAGASEGKGKGTKGSVAALVGRTIAERAKKTGIVKAVADRGPYRYHGRVKALVDAARAEGLQI